MTGARTVRRTGRRQRWADLGAACAAIAMVSVLAVLIAAVVQVSSPRLTNAAAVEMPDLTSGDVYLRGCGDTASQRPMTVNLWCASGDFYVSNLQWTSWGEGGAEAVGTLFRNSCDCASGRIETYPVHVRLFKTRVVRGAVAFQRLRLNFPRAATTPGTPAAGDYQAVPGGFERVGT